MGGACTKNKAKQPKRADPKELEERARREAEEKAAAEAAAREADERARAEAAAAEAAAARAREERERAEAEAAAAALAAEQARQEEEARRQREEEERRAAEEELRAQQQMQAAEQKESEAEGLEKQPQEGHPELEFGGKEVVAEDVASEATMETARPMHKMAEEPQYGAAHGGRKARTVTPCDMTAVDETSKYLSKRCGCDIGDGHDENNCPICQSIDLSDAPLLN
ncbi:caldesmon [Cyclospora cayetanensis]|uniref:Glideosome-associated protein GAP45 n=2 Tax=Cyclospora cayetanensis TaxID=88456 RepID=A0A1D3CWP7_9EIME|nr:caldesmon [Cyclospora cayetanensis]OEH75623.1 glideosome-associated protein GAP45 [Cyclospora cayetanensis]